MRRIVFVLMASVLILSACEEGLGTGTERACTHFRNVMSDVSAGILNDAELRGKLGEVYNDAKFSEDPGIASGAEAMFAAVTTGSLGDLGEAIGEFDESCARLDV